MQQPAFIPTNPFVDYWTVQEFCDAAGVARRTADRWHQQRRGPRRTKLGKRVLYCKRDVTNWLENQTEGGDPR